MSQVYLSKQDHAEGRGLDSRIVKSCILDSHLWTRVGRAWESRNSYLFSWTVPWLKKSRPCGLSRFQIVIRISYDIILHQIICHPHSIIVEMSLSWEDLTYAILSLSKRGSPDLVAKCRWVLWSKSRKRVSTRHTAWY